MTFPGILNLNAYVGIAETRAEEAASTSAQGDGSGDRGDQFGRGDERPVAAAVKADSDDEGIEVNGSSCVRY